jgi:hypothetical protein
MWQYSQSEIQDLIEAPGGNEHEQAAAIAVVTQSIIESRRLGRIATKTPESSWNRGVAKLRGQHVGNWANEFRK